MGSWGVGSLGVNISRCGGVGAWVCVCVCARIYAVGEGWDGFNPVGLNDLAFKTHFWQRPSSQAG